MERNFYYGKSEDSKKLINILNEKIGPIYKELIEKGYTPEQISHGINLWSYDTELNYYLDLHKR